MELKTLIDRNDFHLTEFETLHSESGRYIKELFSLERYVVAGTIAVYAWLIVNPSNDLPTIAWCLPLIFGFLGILRSIAIGFQLKCLSKYLRTVEKSFIRISTSKHGDDHPVGWECFWRAQKGQKRIVWSAITFWSILLVFQALVALYFICQ